MKIATYLISAALLTGCYANPVRWQPTEPQKQAADLAVKDLMELVPHTRPAGEPYRAEAQAAAEVTQTYVGLPQERPTPLSPVNEQIIGQAIEAAPRRPTFSEAADATIDTTVGVTDAGFGLAEALLGLGTTVLGTWGATKAARKVGEWRAKIPEVQAERDTIAAALRETAQAIDAAKDTLPPTAVGTLKNALKQFQSKESKKVVTDARN